MIIRPIANCAIFKSAVLVVNMNFTYVKQVDEQPSLYITRVEEAVLRIMNLCIEYVVELRPN
jgi:hypothetical protein